MSAATYTIGDLCSFAKGASTPRDRMYSEGDYLYLHYGDLYSGHELYVDVNKPQKPIPFIRSNERIKQEQFVSDGDIIYILTSETVEDLGKSLCLINPGHAVVVAGTETTVMRVERRDILVPRYLNYLLQTNLFKKTLQQYVTGMKVFRVHPRDIAKISISIPNVRTQTSIVRCLDAMHKMICLNKQINGRLAA